MPDWGSPGPAHPGCVSLDNCLSLSKCHLWNGLHNVNLPPWLSCGLNEVIHVEHQHSPICYGWRKFLIKSTTTIVWLISIFNIHHTYVLSTLMTWHIWLFGPVHPLASSANNSFFSFYLNCLIRQDWHTENSTRSQTQLSESGSMCKLCNITTVKAKTTPIASKSFLLPRLFTYQKLF
jgi:hypothetical protein